MAIENTQETRIAVQVTLTEQPTPVVQDPRPTEETVVLGERPPSDSIIAPQSADAFVEGLLHGMQKRDRIIIATYISSTVSTQERQQFSQKTTSDLLGVWVEIASNVLSVQTRQGTAQYVGYISYYNGEHRPIKAEFVYEDNTWKITQLQIAVEKDDKYTSKGPFITFPSSIK